MGAIYEAEDARTGETRALKVLLPALVQDPDMRERFALEATATADLTSPHLVRVLEVGIDEASGAPFFAMELLAGEDAGERLRRAGRLSLAEALPAAQQIARGLAVIHEAGIVHRDLKPENLFLVDQGEDEPLVKILDFGVAKLIATGSQSIHTTRSLGTPLYMAPEQIEGDAAIDERADLYALGQLLYTLLVGVPFFAEEARGKALFSVLLRVMRGRLEPATVRAARAGVALPASFDAWFARATAFDPSDRFRSAAEQIEALGSALASSPVAVSGGFKGLALAVSLSGTHDRARPWLAVSLVAAGVVAAIFAASRPAVLGTSPDPRTAASPGLASPRDPRPSATIPETSAGSGGAAGTANSASAAPAASGAGNSPPGASALPRAGEPPGGARRAAEGTRRPGGDRRPSAAGGAGHPEIYDPSDFR
jgi:serine/threonine-protein kinase